jgi:hypothetical protein
MLAPAVQHAVQQRAVLNPRQYLHEPTAVSNRTEAHEVQLARIADPSGAVQRAVRVLAPPQPNVELTRVQATLIGVVEARKRVVLLGRRVLSSEVCRAHMQSPAFRREWVLKLAKQLDHRA